MILYKVIKYSILDYFIESLFNSFAKNLLLHKRSHFNINEVRKGMRFSIIRRRRWDGMVQECYDCDIAFTYRRKNTHGEVMYTIEFTFKDKNFKTTGGNFHIHCIYESEVPEMEFIR